VKKSNDIAQKAPAFDRKSSVTDSAGAQRSGINPPGHVLSGVEAVRLIASLWPQRRSRELSSVQHNGTSDATPTNSTAYIPIRFNPKDRRTFIGGSDARIIMGSDETDLVRLWREKRGEVEAEDLSDNLGIVTKDLNRRWYQRNTGHVIGTCSGRSSIPSINGWRRHWTAWSNQQVRSQNSCCHGISRKRPPPKTHGTTAAQSLGRQCEVRVLSITGGGKWVELTLHADPLYQHLLLTAAEKKFWRCVENGETRRLFGIEPPPLNRINGFGVCQDGKRGSVGNAELVVNVVQVDLHRPLGQS
jgi:hypothetical protein